MKGHYNESRVSISAQYVTLWCLSTALGWNQESRCLTNAGDVTVPSVHTDPDLLLSIWIVPPPALAFPRSLSGESQVLPPLEHSGSR